MKLKNILALAVACGAALIMSVAAHAATEVKVQGATTDAYGCTVPIVLNTTDVNIDELCGAQIYLYYDASKWSYYQIANDASITDRRGNKTSVGSVAAGVITDGKLSIVYTNDMSVGAPAPDANGNIALCTVTFDTVPSTVPAVSDTEFTIGVKELEDYNTGGGLENNYYLGENDLTSFFTFDVTGDLGGNEVVALAASTDGGVTMQPLEYYVSTDWTDGTEYASATTKFLVAVKNTQGTAGFADITIYGEKADGTYVPLTTYDQSNFLVQTFKYE